MQLILEVSPFGTVLSFIGFHWCDKHRCSSHSSFPPFSWNSFEIHKTHRVYNTIHTQPPRDINEIYGIRRCSSYSRSPPFSWDSFEVYKTHRVYNTIHTQGFHTTGHLWGLRDPSMPVYTQSFPLGTDMRFTELTNVRNISTIHCDVAVSHHHNNY